MAIPNRPLNWQPLEMTIDQSIAFANMMQTNNEIGGIDIGWAPVLKEILCDTSDWTAEEVGGLRWRELLEVFATLKSPQETAIPPPTSEPSTITNEAQPTLPLGGPAS